MVPLILCIDVEPDAHVFGPGQSSPWSGFENMLRLAPALRARIEGATGEPAHFGWSLRIDHQIAMGYGSPTYAAEKYRAQLDDLAAAGDAMGVHPHAWRWDAEREVTVAEHADRQWVDSCTELAVGRFREVFDRVPDYHRFGAQYMSTPTMNLLRSLGVTIDLTVEPGEGPDRDAQLPGTVWTGQTGDFRGSPSAPYQPSPADYLQPAGEAGGESTLWEVPLTSSGRSRFPLPPRRLRSRLRHPVRSAHGLVRRLAPAVGASGPAGNRLLAMWLDWPDPRHFWDAAFDAAASQPRPYLAFAIRTDTGSDPALRRTFTRIMGALTEDKRVADLCFVTPAEALAQMGLAPTSARLGCRTAGPAPATPS
jgi:hypothetical protein